MVRDFSMVRRAVLRAMLVSGSVFAAAAAASAAEVTFFGDASPGGTGQVAGQTFNWAAEPALVNAPPVRGSGTLSWGVGGNPSSNGFDFDLTLTFPAGWTFQQITFSALNTNAGDNVFAVQLLDELGEPIDASALIADSTSGFGAQPWSYDAAEHRWEYATVQGSVNGHNVTLSRHIEGVAQLVIDVDDHLGVDDVSLSVAPCPADLDGDGTVGTGDLLVLLAAWGACPAEGACDADLDGDGTIGTSDLLALLSAWDVC